MNGAAAPGDPLDDEAPPAKDGLLAARLEAELHRLRKHAAQFTDLEYHGQSPLSCRVLLKMSMSFG